VQWSTIARLVRLKLNLEFGKSGLNNWKY